MSERGQGRERRGENVVAAVLQVTAQPIWVVDSDGLIRFANPAAVSALGYDDAGELLGRHSHETIHYRRPDGSAYPASECPMLLPRTTGETVTSELDWFFRRDGSMFPVSFVSVPIDLPEGRGAVVAFNDIERRRRAEEQLREREAALTEQQAALREVATLVAGDAASADVFAAVAQAVGRVFRTPLVQMSRYEPDGTATVIAAWSERPHPFQAGTRWPLDGPTISTLVRDTGRPGRLDDLGGVKGRLADAVRRTGLGSVAGAPIVVGGRVWGVIATGAAADQRLPVDIEHRLAEFTELVASAIANAQAREDVQRLAEEQGALRRVATVVAQGAPREEVFSIVAHEIARVTGLELIVMGRFDPGRMMTSIGAAGEHPYQPGTRWPLDGGNVSSLVLDTGRPVTIDPYAEMEGTIAEAAHTAGIQSGVGAPIVVDGRVWGTVSAGGTDRVPLPPDIERRLTQFTELVATAVSNTQAREELRRLADEQSALRRVATLVARGAPPAEVFAAVAGEVAAILELPLVEMCRYDSDATATVIGAVGEHPFQTGTRWTLDGPSLTAQVGLTGRPARVEDYTDIAGSIGDAARIHGVRAGVAAPIVVDGRVWGVVSAGAGEGVSLQSDAEHRLNQFTELVATALSNTQAREDLERLAGEQAGLRRIATLVAEGAHSQLIFDAVCEETGRLFAASTVNLVHFTTDGLHVAMSGWSERGVHVPAGTTLPLDGPTIDTIVRDSGAPGRCDSYEGVEGELAALIRRLGIKSEVGAPVTIDGEVWGALIAGTDQPEPLAAGTEHRLAGFAELIATAVSNATTRSELLASRARIVTAADEQRRRVVRDLHDGAQQRLVNAVITLQIAHGQAGVPPGLAPLIDEALRHAEAAIDDLRELAHGIHPALLTSRGLAAAVEGLADRAPVPVEVEISDRRYAPAIESAAYFVSAEALTNVAKYAQASRVQIHATVHAGALTLIVEDDGIGGARLDGGRGLAGLLDRVAALDGTLTVDSPPAHGTRICAEIPLS